MLLISAEIAQTQSFIVKETFQKVIGWTCIGHGLDVHWTWAGRALDMLFGRSKGKINLTIFVKIYTICKKEMKRIHG
jgi:hypothetical protein